MPTTQTTLQPPPYNRNAPSKPEQLWNFTLQNAHPLIEVDTSKGNENAAPPPAGLNQSTGQSNQNVEITLIKTSSDANTFTLSGSNLPLGPYTLTVRGQALKIKSNGTVWLKSS